MEKINEFIESLIGKTEDEAKKMIMDNGYDYRETFRDGAHYMVTDDFRLDRVNLDIENCKIIKADLG